MSTFKSASFFVTVSASALFAADFHQIDPSQSALALTDQETRACKSALQEASVIEKLQETEHAKLAERLAEILLQAVPASVGLLAGSAVWGYPPPPWQAQKEGGPSEEILINKNNNTAYEPKQERAGRPIHCHYCPCSWSSKCA